MGKRGISLAAIVLSAVLLLSMMPSNSSAFPYRVRGYLETEGGTPIPQATIKLTGEVYNVTSGQTEEGTSSFVGATSGSGFFDISFGVDEPGGLSTGDIVTLSFSDDIYEASSPFTVTGLGGWCNLTAKAKAGLFDSLFSPIGIAVIVLILFVLILAGYWFSTAEKEEEQKTEDAKQKVGRRRR